MTDRPIIFSAAMVRALLDGRKTQTRRVLKKRPALDALATFGPSFLGKPGCADLIGFEPYDRLWVRENFAMGFDCDDHDMPIGDEPKPFYAASYDGMRWYDPEYDDLRDEPRWKPSIHMPRWASRLTLAVTGVRVQRLNEISEEDARAEGCVPEEGSINPNYLGPARSIFHALWDELHGAGSWDANPFVVAITFAVHKANIDAMEKAGERPREAGGGDGAGTACRICATRRPGHVASQPADAWARRNASADVDTLSKARRGSPRRRRARRV